MILHTFESNWLLESRLFAINCLFSYGFIDNMSSQASRDTPEHKSHMVSQQLSRLSHVQRCQGCVGGTRTFKRRSALSANPVVPTPPQPPSVSTMKHTVQSTNTSPHKHDSPQVQLRQGCVGGKGLCNRSSALSANPIAPTPPQPPCVGTMKHTTQSNHTTPQTSLTAGSALSRLCWWQGTVQSKQRPHRQSRCPYHHVSAQ